MTSPTTRFSPYTYLAELMVLSGLSAIFFISFSVGGFSPVRRQLFATLYINGLLVSLRTPATVMVICIYAYVSSHLTMQAHYRHIPKKGCANGNAIMELCYKESRRRNEASITEHASP